MFEFLKRLSRFLANMDAKTATSLGLSLTLLSFVVSMFFFGQHWLNLDDNDMLTGMLARAAASPLALVAVVAVYSLLALTGFPQFVLFAATVIAFGPVMGALYSWIGTMASATFTFGLGHFLGGGWVRRYGGERAQTTIDFLARHGIVASSLVRIVPSAPFIVVNAAAGAAHMPLWKYWFGTGIGIVPKIAIVALAGAFTPDKAALQQGIQGIVDFFLSRDPRHIAVLVVVIAAWIGLLFLARRAFHRMRRRDEDKDSHKDQD